MLLSVVEVAQTSAVEGLDRVDPDCIASLFLKNIECPDPCYGVSLNGCRDIAARGLGATDEMCACTLRKS